MIVVECNADELLIKTMGFAKKMIHHAGCKGKVLKKVRILSKTIGIVDEDPHSKQPGELKRYKVIEKKGKITLLEKENDKSKFLIRISPDLEHWILRRARENKISPGDFSLPDKPGELHRFTRIKKNRKFIDFLNKLIDSDDEIKVMQEWVTKILK